MLFMLIAKPIKTKRVMENIAKEMLMEQGPLQLFSDNNKPIYEGIEGLIVIDRKEIDKYFGDSTRYYKKY